MGTKQARPSNPVAATTLPVVYKEMKEVSSPRYLVYNLSVISAKKGLIQEVNIKTVSVEKMVSFFQSKEIVTLSIDKQAATISIIIKDTLTFNIPPVILN